MIGRLKSFNCVKTTTSNSVRECCPAVRIEISMQFHRMKCNFSYSSIGLDDSHKEFKRSGGDLQAIEENASVVFR